jgi:6-phosphogluconate dehydrogenase
MTTTKSESSGAALALIGAGRMGGAMAARLAAAGQSVALYDRDRRAAEAAVQATPAAARGRVTAHATLGALAESLATPRAFWLMVPAAAVDAAIATLAPHLSPGDVVIDGGNSFYGDALPRAKRLAEAQVRYLDVGTSGGIAGGTRGYCLMIGGDRAAYDLLTPIFAALAPGVAAAPRSDPHAGKEASPAEQGYLYCGGTGAGHFVKMVHNGIEYGMMAAIAEGFNIMQHAGIGKTVQAGDAETTPLRHPERLAYDLDLPRIAELWRRGSVVASWLLDLTAHALTREPSLASYVGRVSDSGEGRWALEAAITAGVPAPVLSASLFARFSSRGEDLFADKLLAAMRREFGGHHEVTT